MPAQFRFTDFLVIGIYQSTYNAPGVQSPVIDSLINQIIAAQEIKKITAVGASTGLRINVELLHAATGHTEDRLALVG